jgi:hypothetical protein
MGLFMMVTIYQLQSCVRLGEAWFYLYLDYSAYFTFSKAIPGTAAVYGTSMGYELIGVE